MGSKEYLKKNFQGAYDVSRAIHHGIADAKRIKAYEVENVVVHEKNVPVSAPLSKIYVSPSVKRINLVLDELTTSTVKDEKMAKILKLATEAANTQKYALRMITRNNLANPKVYTDFLKENQLKAPMSMSFYTDFSARISSSVYRLEVTDGDVFFTEAEYNKLKGWKDGKK